jgi:hypothetical protein
MAVAEPLQVLGGEEGACAAAADHDYVRLTSGAASSMRSSR